MISILEKHRTTLRSYTSAALAFFSTMPIVGIHFGSKDVSIYRILLFISLIWMIVECVLQRKVFFTRRRRWLDLWLAEMVLACLIGSIFLRLSDPEWAQAAKSYISKVFVLLLFSILWGSAEKWNREYAMVTKGFIVGCLVNCVWAVVDAVGFYLLGKSINNIVFSGYIERNEIRYGMLSLIQGGMIRSGGFNSDPAQIGFIAPVVAGYAVAKKKPFYLIICIGAVVAGASTTALVGTVIAVLVFGWLFWKKRKTFISTKRIVIVCLSVICVGIGWFLSRSRIENLMEIAYTKFFGRINDVYAGSGIEDNIRVNYIRCFPNALQHVLPFLLFGSGIGTASLGYSKSAFSRLLLGNKVNSAYDMENTYIAYFFDTGIIGFMLLIIVLYILYRNYRSRCKFYREDSDIIFYSTIMSTIICFMFYHYILFAPQMLIFTVALSRIDKGVI